LNINALATGSFSPGALKRDFVAAKVDDPKYALEEGFVEKRLAAFRNPSS